MALSSMTPLQIMAMSAIGQAPAILMPMLRMQGIVRPPYNLIISNVPGPNIALYSCGAELEAMYPMGPITDGAGLNITIFSYRGTIHFGLVACRETVPDLDRLAGHLHNSLDELLKAAEERTAERPALSKRPPPGAAAPAPA